jgi:putative phosphoesterase
MTTLWVISDTRIPERTRKLPKEFLEKINGEDMIFHCGDLVCLEVLKELERKALVYVYAVFGNMHYPELESLLPKKE